MRGYSFSKFIPEKVQDGGFDGLMNIFTQLLNFTAGDPNEALAWMNELDKQHHFTNNDYGMGDFIEDLKDKGFIDQDRDKKDGFQITSKTEQTIRKSALEEIFGKLKKSGKGSHNSNKSGQGEEKNADRREFEFGDSLDQIDMTASIHNAQLNHGIGDFTMTERDLEVEEMDYRTLTSTVLMIDISHSMILYGEDRITLAKKVAMALAELISTKYPKDTLDIVVFGNDAWPITVKDLPYLQVGPYHTNTYSGLELATDILRRRKTTNKQIFMITDGKPTCLKEGNRYYKNSIGLDRKVINKTLNMAAQCKRLHIPITTFMIARDPYLQQFVRQFTEVNGGKAFYSSLKGLGEYIFEDYIKNRRKTYR
ncbi:short form Mg-chelase associated protein [Arcticibacter svalbardensis MN12-7]|uniref:Short form Mg-chelase associated protein n=1 Tax=Arcticibacter svalbardensis MN12-7 TaxID=1150600 RepID=R9GTP0_9SPHI|nr:VWA domain-containing protein [Arcticibacter svalbardensis]EOR95202.1 short form Mg-chelase associated protein [Arcticibacter svalbardensis MN12-7]